MSHLRSRQAWFGNLQRLQVAVDAIDPDTVTAEAVKAHLESVDRIWKKIDEAHERILSTAADDDAVLIQQQALEPMEDLLTDIKTKLYRYQALSSTSEASKTRGIKLPEMTLPSFEGKYEDWPTFADLFKASVDKNVALSPSQKLQYLKSCTKGDAASLIKSFIVTDANYKEAWNLLEQQYDNQREIIHAHVRNLLFQTSLKSESSTSLQKLLTTTLESIRSLKVMGRPTEHWDDIIAVLLIEKFDGETKAEWARSLKGTAPPTFKDVQDFIMQHIRTLHAKGNKAAPSTKPAQQNQGKRMNINSTATSKCQYCKGNHQLYQCTQLRDMPSDKRHTAVMSTGVCLNCLKEGHSKKDCPSTGTCKKCEKKHNTFLHIDKQGKLGINSTQQQQQSELQSNVLQSTSTNRVNINSSSTFSSTTTSTLLKTALANVIDQTGVKHQVRVFIDEGGEGGLIKDATMQRLGLKKEKADITITGVGGTAVSKSKWKTYVTLHSQCNNSSIDVELYSIPKVTGAINHLEKSNRVNWSHIAGLQLADPEFYKGGDIDILLGSNIAPYILKPELRKLNQNSPVAQNTIFGWVLFGNTGAAPSQPTFKINTFKCDITAALKRFWEIEEVPSVPPLTLEEQACEDHFQATHQRQVDGRYVLRLPFNIKKDQLGESRDQAYRRLLSLERRFQRQPQYKEAYIQFMREYEQLNHMEKVNHELNHVSQTYYLQHHFVLKKDSTTTKQRTVFDGSAKTSSGVSLNDTLMVGATVQPDLYTLLLRFRYNKVGLKADIAKMYRQFLIHSDDRDYQRILWREDSSRPVEEYRLTTNTYGTASAPFLATRCLNQLAYDEKDRYPAASIALLSSTYIDDFLGTSKSTTEAISLVKEMIGITSAAGMQIRKWCSNDPGVMNSVPVDLRETCAVSDFNTDSSIKALGIKWQLSSDEFLFSVSLPSDKKISKRYVLSEISKTFDPLGWLCPVTITAKILMQKIWLEGTDWDSELSPNLQHEWESYIVNLQDVSRMRIPRCVIASTPKTIEIHAFSDSSERAYSTAIYLKCTFIDGSVSVNLLTSRTKVAPLKTVSLPRLELCGAKLLAKTVAVVQKSLEQPHLLFCWTDSMITLRWISAHSRKWKTFVANRVSVIQSLTPPECWHHVRSEDNPADLPSRGVDADALLKSDLWWHGPLWLQQKQYPTSNQQFDEEEVKKEERSKQISFYHSVNNDVYHKLVSAFSSFSKLCRVTAYLRRFIVFLKDRRKNYSVTPTTTELQAAKYQLIKWTQAVSFPTEVHELKRNKSVPSNSKLLQLNPFMDSMGLVRVGGRIQRAMLSENSIHPIILPHNQKVTELIIADVHHVNLHSGFTLTNSVIRREYWILRGRDTIRHYIRKCVTCRRSTASTAHQLMGSLPVGRVTANRPFLHAGVDFAGPFLIKYKKGRHFTLDKAYFAIYVCFATKAVHLEAVTSLSSEAFVACYERFVSRRGISAHLYSDCGTNFVGSDKILQNYLQQQQSSLQSQFATHGTTWHFNPPSAPHQGGLWEAGVKSVKRHFFRVVGKQTLLLEQFQTLLCKIEACLNSRPICAISCEPTEEEVITPGHFLIGEALNNIPEPDVTGLSGNRLNDWNHIRQMTQHFWRRWRNEYLTMLQQRFKWKQKRDNLQCGDVVVVADDQAPVTKWKLGRIISTHPGADGLVRSATVKTAFGVLNRPITKLCPLISYHS